MSREKAPTEGNLTMIVATTVLGSIPFLQVQVAFSAFRTCR